MNSIKKLIIAFIRLSRIRTIFEYYWWVLIVSIIASGLHLTLINYVLATLITISIHAYSFIVNDCEDADDDSMDSKKAKRNPVSSGFITYRQGILILQLTSFPALILSYVISGPVGVIVILSAIFAGHLYSWKRVRLKSLPFIDLVSHAYALGMFQVLYFMILPGAEISVGSFLIFYGIGLFSSGGALYNQLRDHEVDQKSGLNNTTNVIGYDRSRLLAMGLYSVGLLFIIAGIAERIFVFKIL